MDREKEISELRTIIEAFLKNEGLELVELIYRFEGRDLFLRVLTDTPEGGITLGECARLNKEIGFMLEEKEAIKEKYTLEISSPGLDRPLKTRNDFARCVNRQIKFFLRVPVNGKLEWDGVIQRVEEDCVYIDAKGMMLAIPIAHIIKAKQILITV